MTHFIIIPDKNVDVQRNTEVNIIQSELNNAKDLCDFLEKCYELFGFYPKFYTVEEITELYNGGLELESTYLFYYKKEISYTENLHKFFTLNIYEDRKSVV